MQFAVLCVVVLAHWCYVTGAPHGYDVKGGASGKADASTAAGAYSGLGALPIGIPVGGGFSGSFTKSSSASSSSSSASSSSSSFSFAGSGLPSVSGGCTTGICQNSGSHDKNSYTTDQNSGTINGNPNSNNGYPNTYSGTVAPAGAIGDSQLYFGSHNKPLCTGNKCFEKVDDCKDSDCEGGVVSPDKKCESGQCFPTLSTHPSSFDTKDNENKCTSGQCDNSPSKLATIPTKVEFSLDKGNSNKCQSGKCDIIAPLGCFSGQCTPSPNFSNTPSAFKPNNGPHSEGHIKDTTSTFSSLPNAPSTYGFNNKPNTNSPPQGATSLDYNPNECSSGQCKSSPISDTPHTVPDNGDIAINIEKNLNSNINKENNNYEKTNSQGSSNCAYGNCASNPPLRTPANYPGNYPYPSLNIHVDTSKCVSPDCKNDVYNNAAASGSISGPAYNKPAIYLTTPIQESSCTTPNCKPVNFVSEHQTPEITVPVSISQPNSPYDSKKKLDCAAGRCGNNQPNSYFITTNVHSPNPKNPNSEYDPSDNKCTSPNCASTLQHPSYQSSHAYNSARPTVFDDQQNHKSSTTLAGQFTSTFHNPITKLVNYPQDASPHFSPSIVPSQITGYQPIQPSPSLGPNYSNQIKPNQPKTEKEQDTIPPFVPLTPTTSQSCSGNGCSEVPLAKPNFGTNAISTQPNVVYTGLPSPSISSHPSLAQSIPTSHGIHSFPSPSNTNKQPHDGRDKPVYTGGFGGPSGLLKPNDNSLPSTISAVSKPVAGEQSSIPCSTDRCSSPASYGQIHNENSNSVPAVAHSTTTCAAGKCSPEIASGTNLFNGAHASAGAAASANAVAYTGGFGGPPGFLKPYDGGNVKEILASLSGKNVLLSTGSSGNHGNGVHSPYNAGAGSIAQAFAAAGAGAGTFGGHPGHYSHTESGENKTGRGCTGGCSTSQTAKNGSGLNSQNDTGLADLSAAKAGAVSGANAGSFGFGGSYASSSASSHASASTAIKGYGRR